MDPCSNVKPFHDMSWVSSTYVSHKHLVPSKPPCMTIQRWPTTVEAAVLRAVGPTPETEIYIVVAVGHKARGRSKKCHEAGAKKNMRTASLVHSCAMGSPFIGAAVSHRAQVWIDVTDLGPSPSIEVQAVSVPQNSSVTSTTKNPKLAFYHIRCVSPSSTRHLSMV